MKNINLLVVLGCMMIVTFLGLAGYYYFIRDEATTNTDAATSEVETPKTCTTYEGRVVEQCIEDYIGLTQEQAFSKAESHDYTPKVASVDGKSQANTDEFGWRIFFDIENGIVVDGFFD